MQDLGRLFPEEKFDVQVTLVEADQILSAFDEKLRNYTEKLMRKRESMNIVQASVVGKCQCCDTTVTVIISSQ